MNAIILCAGEGRKIWPYSRYHNKSMLKIGNQPIIQHTTKALLQNQMDHITLVTNHHGASLRQLYRHNAKIEVIELTQTQGSADSLKQVSDKINHQTFVFYGDCFIHEEDIKAFIESNKDILISQLHQEPSLQICAEVDENNQLIQFWGHPRGDFHYFPAGFKMNPSMIPYLDTTAIFNQTKVGLGSPEECYLESALNDFIHDKNTLTCFCAQYQIYDIDKPWHILEANHFYNEYRSKQIKKTVIGKNTYLSQSAQIKRAWIGEDCFIGENVVIQEGCVIEDHTRIDHGAILGKGVHVGKNCVVENYCKIGDYSSIGDECIVGHTSELIEAVLFDKVYCYHFGEYYGVIGTHSDLGAGTTCGTLRFDDGKTQHRVCGHKEIPSSYSNACYIGDYCRTGVGALLLPGCKIGSKSVVGSGVILNEDVEENTLIYVKQELCKTTWNDDKYGW